MDTAITHNKITYVDAQAMRLKHPETFEAPSKEELNALRIGDNVKICVNNERFWVLITSVNGEMVTGTIDNDLLQQDLKYKDLIEFPKNCIFSIGDF